MNFLEFPTIIKRKIFSYCDFQSKLLLSQSCQKLYDVLGDDVWEAELERKFGSDWYQLFERLLHLEEVNDDEIHNRKQMVFNSANDIMFNEKYNMGNTPENVMISKILRKTINMTWNKTRKTVDNPWIIEGKKVNYKTIHQEH